MTTLHLLHTNDFHNHLTPVQAAFIQQQKQALENVLLLDAGDAVSAGNFGVRPGGEPILTLMSETGYDAMTLGNREFHIADALLRAKISKASFPILCANIRYKDDHGGTLPVVPHLIKTLPNGIRVGIFGLTVPMVTPRMAARHVSAHLFDDPVTVAHREISLLRPQVDLLIALSHIGLREDERLAAACPELDLIVGGHTHAVLSEPKVINGVSIVQAGWYGHYLGSITVEVDPGRKPNIAGCLLPLDESALSPLPLQDNMPLC